MTIENDRLDDVRLGTAIRKKKEFNLWLYEHFHGNNGTGLGASHQTGWTGLDAKFVEPFGLLDAEEALGAVRKSAFRSKAEIVRKESSAIDEAEIAMGGSSK